MKFSHNKQEHFIVLFGSLLSRELLGINYVVNMKFSHMQEHFIVLFEFLMPRKLLGILCRVAFCTSLIFFSKKRKNQFVIDTQMATN